MRDQWLDREAAEMDSQQYFDEMALDDELIRLHEKAQAKQKEIDREVLALLEQESELVF